MKYLLFKSLKYRDLFLKKEQYYYKLKFLFNNLSDNNLKYKIAFKLKNLKNPRIKFKRRCVVTGFSKSYRKFLLSRITLREFASFGYLTGVRKSSW
jgi:ribosomal protein S14